MQRLRLGELLVRSGLLTEGQVATALAYQAQWRCKLGEALVGLGLLSAEQVQRALSTQLKVPFVRGEEMLKVPAAVVKSVPVEVLARLEVCPLRVSWQGTRKELYVATSQPENLPLLDELAFVTGFTVHPVLALAADIQRTLRRHGVLTGTRGKAHIDLPSEDGAGFVVTHGVDL